VEAASFLRENLDIESAIEDFVSRKSAIVTIQRTISGKHNRSAFMKEMVSKQRFMVHIGGIGLDLTNENIVTAGKTILSLDLKSKEREKKQLEVTLVHSTIFMGAIAQGNNIYLSGGRNVFGQFILGEECPDVRKSFYSLDIKEDTLKSRASMIYPRSHHGFVKYKGELWAVGGTDGKGPLKTVESYDRFTDMWQKRADLLTGRTCSMTVVYKDKIWVIGGRDGLGNVLQSVETYDSKSKQWKLHHDFPLPIMLGAALTVGSRMFVVGGMSGEPKNPKTLDTIYRFDDSEEKWVVWANMSEPRVNHSCTSYGNYINIIGGHNIEDNVPKNVKGSVCFDTSKEPPKEFVTLALGSNKVGMAVVMFGDSERLKESYASSQSRRSTSHSFDDFSVMSASSEL